MTNSNSISSMTPGALPRPRHFLGEQPVVAVARYHSQKPCDWNMLYHVVTEIAEPYCGIEFLDLDPSEVDCGKWPLYDYDCEEINNWFFEELEIDGGFEIKWANRCQMHYREDDPLHILRGDNTEVDANDHPIDGYWEVSVLNRDDAAFWEYLLSDTGVSIGINWEPRQDKFSELVLDWVRDHPVVAEKWLNSGPTPAELVGESDELNNLIKKIKRAIRQGSIPLE